MASASNLQNAKPPERGSKEVLKSLNIGHYYEDNFGAYILYKLCGLENVYDWKFGMEKKEFGKFDDIVVGIQHQKEDSMMFHAFQLKGYDDKDDKKGRKIERSFKMSMILPELVENTKEAEDIENQTSEDDKGPSKFCLHEFFKKGFMKIKDSSREIKGKKAANSNSSLTVDQIESFAIYAQFTFHPGPDYTKYFVELSPDEFNKDIASILPTLQEGNKKFVFRKLSETAIERLTSIWGKNNSDTQEDSREFLRKVIIASGQPGAHEVVEKGTSECPQWWNRLRTKIVDINFDRLKHWVSKRELTGIKVEFQGCKKAVAVSELIEEPSRDLLLELFIAPEKISVGREVKGLGAVDKYYIERTFKKKKTVSKDDSNGKQKQDERLPSHQSDNDIDDVEYNMNDAADTDTDTFIPEIPDAEVTKCEAELLLEKVVIIEGEPGLGKSVALLHAAKKLKEQNEKNRRESAETLPVWVIELNAALIANAYSSMPPREEAPLQWLADAIGAQNGSVERHLIDKLGTEKGPNIEIAIYLDGLDEISPVYTNHVIQQLNLLQPKIKLLWISTRNHLGDDVKKTFNTEPYTIQTFSRENQERFLMNFWEIAEGHTTSIPDIIEKLFNSQVVHQGIENIIGLPLLTLMFAQIHEDDCKRIINGELPVKEWNPEMVNMLKLFKTFIDRRFELEYAKLYTHILVNDPLQKGSLQRREAHPKWVNDLQTLKLSYIELHENLSMMHIFHQYEGFEEIASVKSADLIKKLKDDVESGEFTSGIIFGVQGQKLLFVHQLFAEYFAARWLFRELKKVGEDKKTSPLVKFLQLHYTRPENQQVRLFLSYLAAGDCQANIDVVNNIAGMLTSSKRQETETCRGYQSKKDAFQRQPIHLVLENHMLLDRASALLEKNHTISPDNLWDCTLASHYLYLACENDQRLELARAAIGLGADVDHLPCLHAAVMYGNVDIARLLLSHGADLNRQTSYGSPLQIALGSRESKMATLLLCEEWRDRVDVNATTHLGQTPLHLACLRGKLDLVPTLLGMGADVHASIDGMCTPMHMSLKKNITLPEECYASPPPLTLHMACTYGNAGAVKILLRLGADRLEKDEHESIPLHQACVYGKLEIVKLLMEESDEDQVRQQINLINKDGNSALTLANWAGHRSIAKILLENGA